MVCYKHIYGIFIMVAFLIYTYQKYLISSNFCLQIDFDLYKSYVENTIRAPGAPRHLLGEKIEQACWEIVEEEETYNSQHLVTEDVKKLWQIFNRVSLSGSYSEKGPMTDAEEINWLMEKMAANLGEEKCVIAISDEIIPRERIDNMPYSSGLEHLTGEGEVQV